MERRSRNTKTFLRPFVTRGIANLQSGCRNKRFAFGVDVSELEWIGEFVCGAGAGGQDHVAMV